MDIFSCIMGSDNRILKLEPSFLNKKQIPAGYIFRITHNAIMDIHNWIMDTHNYDELWISIIELWISIIELWLSTINQYGYPWLVNYGYQWFIMNIHNYRLCDANSAGYIFPYYT